MIPYVERLMQRKAATNMTPTLKMTTTALLAYVIMLDCTSDWLSSDDFVGRVEVTGSVDVDAVS